VNSLLHIQQISRVLLGDHEQGYSFRHLKAKKHPKKFFAKKNIKIQVISWMKKPNVNHEFQKHG
jgi:hypothetical protein